MSFKDPVAEFARHITACLPFTPNTDQVEAIRKLVGFVLGAGHRQVFVLKGYAGTGKTNLVSALTRALPSVKWRSVLLAPTGRAAKVLSAYSQRQAFTIHKKIYRRELGDDGGMSFSLAENLHRNTLFIVDEASMIGAGGEGSFNNLLEDLFEYVYGGDNCRLLLIGDTAQLPPVGTDESPALNTEYLRHTFHLSMHLHELRDVARQRLESGILLNATGLRDALVNEEPVMLTPAPDFRRVNGEELEEQLQAELSKVGEDNMVLITRSNKRANLFNQSYRNRIRLYEDDLCAGDRIMVVKNNYFWLPEDNGEAGFIANGDMAEITRIVRREDLYGFNFCECLLRFSDYPNLPLQQVNILTNGLYSDSPALSPDDQRSLYEAVLADVQHEPRHARLAYLRKSPYYHALQVKFSYAITCHKSQGGQWPVVFIDQGFLKEENVDTGFKRWLYTAITRATERVYLVNFNDVFFI